MPSSDTHKNMRNQNAPGASESRVDIAGEGKAPSDVIQDNTRKEAPVTHTESGSRGVGQKQNAPEKQHSSS